MGLIFQQSFRWQRCERQCVATPHFQAMVGQGRSGREGRGLAACIRIDAGRWESKQSRSGRQLASELLKESNCHQLPMTVDCWLTVG